MPAETAAPRETWMMYFTVAMLLSPVWYVLSSGPMKIGFEMLGKAEQTHEQVYAPLVWLSNHTPASDAVAWYWGLFPTRREQNDDPLGEWLYSPQARAIRRNLGVGD